MDVKIQQLLNELYAIDGSLREHEEQLVKALEILLSAKPDFKPTPEFVARLKGELMLRAHDMKTAPVQSNNWINFFNMQSRTVASLVVIVAVVVAVGAALLGNRPATQLAFKAESTKVSDNAFGPLAGLQQGGSGTAPAEAVATGRGGGGGGTYTSRPQSGGGGGDMAMGFAPSTMPYPEAVMYEYVYDGEPLELQDKTVEVLKRIKGGLAPLGNIARSISGINLGSFSSLGIQNVTLNEDRDYGYSVFADFFEGSLSVNQNWLRWPNPMAECRDQACVDLNRIQPGQVLSDEEAIKIANDFLDNHGIDRSSLGQPEVQNDWRVMYERMSAPERLSFWVPEQVTLVYPLMIDGKVVYEQGIGMKMGVNVSVDIRTKKVASMYNIFSQNYERSAYDAETDAAVILKIIQQGGYQMYPYRQEGMTVKKIRVGTPVIGYMRYWLPRGNMADELLVPALVFPVLDATDPYNQVKNIVVPLAKELLSQTGNAGPGMGGPIEIMPLKTIDSTIDVPPSATTNQ